VAKGTIKITGQPYRLAMKRKVGLFIGIYRFLAGKEIETHNCRISNSFGHPEILETRFDSG
jgi:hypothetical protein